MSVWATASLPAAGLDLDVLGGRLTFNEGWSPFVQGSLTVALSDPRLVQYLDPRARVRCAGTVFDGNRSRPFDLLVRGRVPDWQAGTVTLTLDCDEAQLIEGALVQAGPWVPTDGSVRFIVQHVLSTIGATLQPGFDDAIIDPAAALWQPGTTGATYLEPILTAAGLRVYCDELRRWWLVDADSVASGGAAFGPANITGIEDTFDLDSDQAYYDAVIIKYGWTDSAGIDQTVYDTAGTPSGYHDISAAAKAPLKVKLDLARNAVLQSAQQCADTGEWFATQVTEGSNGTRTPYETTTITRMTPVGAQIDSMILVDGGHGTSFGVESINGTYWIWHAWAAATAAGGIENELVRFPYKAGSYTRNTVPGMVTLNRFGNARVIPGFDWQSDRVAYRTVNGTQETYTLRRISDARAGIDAPLASITLPTDPPTMQGFATTATALFEYVGAANEPTGDEARLNEYAWDNGRLIDSISTSAIARNPDGSYPGNRHEPEGLHLYRDPLTGAPSLDLGIVVNVLGSYDWRVYRMPLPDAISAAPTRVYSLEYSSPPPAPGAAQRILRRRLAAGAGVGVMARSDLSLTPGMACIAELPDGRTSSGAIASLEFDLESNEMTVATRDVVTPLRYSWLATKIGTSWQSIAAGVTWQLFDPETGAGSATAWMTAPAGQHWDQVQIGLRWTDYGLPTNKTWAGAPGPINWADLPAGISWPNA